MTYQQDKVGCLTGCGWSVAAPTQQGPLCLNGKGYYFHYEWDAVVQTSGNVTTQDARLPRQPLHSRPWTFCIGNAADGRNTTWAHFSPDDELKPWPAGIVDLNYANIFNLCCIFWGGFAQEWPQKRKMRQREAFSHKIHWKLSSWAETVTIVVTFIPVIHFLFVLSTWLSITEAGCLPF